MDIIGNSPDLNSLSSCDINTKFNDRCHADWSESNLISFVTPEGIYILKPQLDIQNGPFQKELIRNPDSRFKHESFDAPTFDSLWQSLDPRQYMEVFLDPALTTHVETLSLDVYQRRFRLAKWSPVIESFPRQCLLAVLTLDYQLLIYTRKNSAWVVIADLSCEHDKLCYPTVHNASSRDDNRRVSQDGSFDSIREGLHSLSFCNVCWKQTQNNGPLLLATTIPGDIVVWQVVIPESCAQDNPSSNSPSLQPYRFDIKVILRTSLKYISSMQFFDNILIVSARDGQVVLFDMTTHLNEFDTPASVSHTNGLAVVKTVNLIFTPPAVTLWHKDNIEVTDFCIQPISQDTFRIVLAKSTQICWSIINYKKRTDSEPATFAISDSISAIDGLDSELTLHRTPATWLKRTRGNKAVLIADDGSFFQLEFAGDHQDKSPEINVLRTGKVDVSRMVPRGLCTSPRGHLITMISSIALVYEPVKILAPTKVVLIPSTNGSEFFVDCIRKLLDESWLAAERVESPMDVFDRIEYLRSIYPLLTPEHFGKLYKTLKEAILELGYPKNDTQFAKLKILAFLLMKLSEQHSLKSLGGDHRRGLDRKDSDKEEADEVILLYNIERILSTTLCEPTAKGDNKQCQTTTTTTMSANQINSLRNYFNWLDKNPRRRIIRDEYLERFKVLESLHADTPGEVCSICKFDIPFVSLTHGTCSNGHRFDRCSRSLLAMDLLSCDELVCEHCKRRYTNYILWPSSNLWLCSYCQ